MTRTKYGPSPHWREQNLSPGPPSAEILRSKGRPIRFVATKPHPERKRRRPQSPIEISSLAEIPGRTDRARAFDEIGARPGNRPKPSQAVPATTRESSGFGYCEEKRAHSSRRTFPPQVF